MSSNHAYGGDEKASSGGAGGAASSQAQAPKLRSGAHYAQWRSDMEVWLERHGAQGVHARAMSSEQWREASRKVEQVKEAALDAALALVLGGDAAPASSATGAASSAKSLSGGDSLLSGDAPDPASAAMKLVKELVERSTRVYGVIYAALPDELRQQAESTLPRGFAYGLWHWLELKYQSTEQDSVGALLEQWVSLRQDEGESFDAYRSRVDKLTSLLKAAKEAPSPRMYSLMLLDRLQPQYKQAVLALKAGGQLKDAEKVQWDTVSQFLNAHEREVRRDGAAASDGTGGAWANATLLRSKLGAGRDEGTRERQQYDGPRTCFWCDEPGHVVRDCPEKAKHKKGSSGGASRGHARFGRGRGGRGGREGGAAPGGAAAEQASVAVRSRNRYGELSSEEDDEEEGSGEQSEDARGRAFCVLISPVERAFAAPAKKLVTQREAEAKADAKAKETAKRAPKPAGGPAPESSGSELKSGAKEEKKVDSQARKPRTYKDIDSSLADDAWGWDTMASVCISGNRDRFLTLRKCPATPVKTADGGIVSAVHSGTVAIRVTTDAGKNIRIVVDNVLFHERFASNLLSGERMTKTLDWEYHSTKVGSWVVTPGGNRITLSTRGRISVMLGAGAERVYAGLTPGSGTRDDVPSELVRLHERLGHMGFDKMALLLRDGNVQGIGTYTPREIAAARRHVLECRACCLGKQSRTNFDHRGLERGSAPAEALHMDTYVVKCPGPDGEMQTTYGISVMDTFSREGWQSFVNSKDAVAGSVINVVKQIETHTGRTVKRIYCDGGTEFINHTLKSFLANKGITIRASPPHTQQLNGVAERTIRTFKDSARTLLAHARAPQWMWRDAARHAVWLWNRTHTAKPTGQTPYQTVMGRAASLKPQTVGVWGCDCYVHQRKEVRSGAMAAKAEPAIYLGHCDGVSAANVLMLSTGKRVVTRDLRFVNGSFRHLAALKRGKDEVDALLEGTSDLLLSPLDSGSARDGMPAQGERDVDYEDDASVLTDAADAQGEVDPDQWHVERILQRRVKRGSGPEYLVRWSGFSSDDDSWEPERNVIELEAYDKFLESQPGPRRSPRIASGDSSADSGHQSEAAYDNHASDNAGLGGGRVEMAMVALRGLQTPDEKLGFDDEQVVMNAISSGIAALEDRTPKTLKEALASNDSAAWSAARQKEYDSCVKLGVWEEVSLASLPKGTNILPCKDVFKIKVDESGDIAQFKARFTPKGFRQKPGVDYHETFARTAMYKTERLALSLTARFDHELVQFDVPSAFINAELDEVVYMEWPAGFGKPGTVCRLLKSLYGLKQSPRNWDKLIHGFITKEIGWKATVSDPSFYYKRSRTGRLMLIYRFVDDMQGQHHLEDAAEFAESSGMLAERFDIKKMDTATWMLGMRITRDRKARTITLDQELYVTKALERFGLAECKVVPSPEVPGASKDTTPGLDNPTDRQRYMEMVGTLQYAAISTRPDIAHAVHYLAAHMVAPTSRHMLAAERVFRYLAGTKEVGLVFGSRNGGVVTDSRGRGTQALVDVCAFADADWAEDRGDRKSISGWVAKLNGDPVSWSSKKQRVVALSTCEAELYAEAAAIQEVLWLRGMLAELGLHSEVGSTVYGDNQAAIAVSKNGVKSQRTKHVDVKYHFVTQTVEDGQVKLQWVPSAQQQADIFTKALAAPVFLGLRKDLMTR